MRAAADIIPAAETKKDGQAMNLLMQLFLTFARIGTFTFGGGYAMIALIERACVEEKQWIDHDDMMNITVIAESTPGPIAINCATFVGYKQKGLAGAAAATLGIVLPSFLIILVLAGVLDRAMALPLVAGAFRGIRLAVGILILDAALKMSRKLWKKPFARGIMLACAAVLLLLDALAVHFSTIGIMLLAGVVSLSVFLFRERAGKEGKA